MYGEFHDAPSLAREAVLSAPTFLAMGRLDAAGALARIGLEAGQKLGDRQTEVNALRTLAEIALAAKKQDEVRRFGAQALALAEEIGDGENVARTWDVLARAEALAGRPSGAIFFRKQAVNAVQALRSSAASLSRELRASQTRSKEALYRDLAGDLLREGRLAEAEQVLAMLKEEEFSAFIRRRSSDGDAKALRLEANAAEAPWAQRYDALREKTAALGQQLRAVKPSSALPPEVLAELFAGLLPPDAAARAAALEPQLAAARAGFDDYLAALAKASAQLAVPPGAQQQGLLQGKLGALGEGTVALYYVLLRDRLHVLLATPKGYTHREVPIAAERLAGLSAQWRVVLQQPGRDPRPGGRALYDLLVAPVEKELLLAKARTVMLALDGGLRYLPFAALYDGQQYLVQRWQFTVYTAAAGAVVDRPPRPQWTIAALGVSEAARGFESLPGVPAELADIVKKPGSATGVLPGTALLDGAFTRAALIDALRARPAVLHLASHFAFEPDGTEAESFLLLGGGKTLSLADFAAGEFPVKDLDLLTLSACQTGVGSTGRDGVEVEGFGVLAQRKGAAAVMATLWPVADASTSLFMREFYRRREVGHVTKATSVRAVQVGFITGEYGNESLPLATRGLRRTAPPAREDIAAPPFTVDPKAPFAHPYFWAPFILMGNGL
jgi:CHAT domain-containing protein